MNSCIQQSTSDYLVAQSVDPLPLWKRALDIAVSLAAVPLLAPIAVTIAAATKFNSPGPVLFKQKRVGYRGSEFYCYKFRTMRVNADVQVHQAHFSALMQSNAPMTKMDNRGDSRLIPGGRWLRASGLDELPQIINILKGEMSLVGPRPCLSYEYEQYNTHQRGRFDSVPGLTGLWQVSGKNKTTFEQMINLDIRYGKTKSLLGDLAIMVRTPFALFQQLREISANSKALNNPQHKSITPARKPAREQFKTAAV